MRHVTIPRLSPPLFALLLLSGQIAAAQPLGAFSWQMAPYCNVLTLTVTQAGSVYTLDGFDAQCGAARQAPVTGVASFNPDGSIGMGLTIVNTPGGEPTHVEAAIDLTTLGGPWSDSRGGTGSLVFNGAGGTESRPTGQMRLTAFANSVLITARRANGTPSAPTPVTAGGILFRLSAQGFHGSLFADSSASITISATETFAPSSNGTRISFATTPNGGNSSSTRMTIDHDGQVGIGTVPEDQLDVDGDIRVGTSGTNGCVRNNNGGALVGMCASDARFKRDVTAYANMLPRVAALRPVQFSWRPEAFPERAFGPAREAGLIAQEVERVLPELVTTDEEGYKAVDYSKLPLIALQAIKELKERNDALERRLAAIEAHVKR